MPEPGANIRSPATEEFWYSVCRENRMHRTLATLFALTALSLTAPPAPHAAPPGTAPAKSAGTGELPPERPALPYITLVLVRDAAVQRELRLKPEQLVGVDAAIAEVDEQFWQLRDVSVKQCGEQLDKLLAKLREGLKAALTPPQAQRLDQLILQARGVQALVSPEIVRRLDLSPQQVERLQKLLREAAAEREKSGKEQVTAVSRQSAAEGRQQKSQTQKALAILTPQQEEKLAALCGQPFDLSRVEQIGCVAPELRGVAAWINTDGVSLRQLRGKVVVVHFWAFGCINCVRNLPHYQGWHEKFKNGDVVIIGIQTPETEAERSLDNLRQQVKQRRIAYPVLFDAAAENWKAWGNNMWPSVYLIDKQGRVRHWWYGELAWEGAKGEEYMRERIEALRREK